MFEYKGKLYTEDALFDDPEFKAEVAAHQAEMDRREKVWNDFWQITKMEIIENPGVSLFCLVFAVSLFTAAAFNPIQARDIIVFLLKIVFTVFLLFKFWDLWKFLLNKWSNS